MTAVKNVSQRERVWLVGIRRQEQTRQDFEASFTELSRLVDTAGGDIVGESHQEIDTPNPKTFIGKGKVEEILRGIQGVRAETVAMDDELTPTQNKNLEEMLGVKVIDRTAVILDIFARRAHTKEGRLQVELAQLAYIQPRLRGMWSHFGQQAGGIGTRGPGETQIEVDRRRVKEKIAKLKERLKEVETHRQIHRLKRKVVSIPMFSLVGYTNAGKSTLFNALTHAGVFVEDKLFATLDPTVRRLKLPSGRQALLADTVGFIRKLPHALVEAFKATFEEIAHADGIIHVVDASDTEIYQHIETVEQVLGELGLQGKPTITVFNKKDRGLVSLSGHHGVPLSAVTGENIPMLLETMDQFLRSRAQCAHFSLPHSRGDILATLYSLGHVIQVEHTLAGIDVVCEIDPKFAKKYSEYLK